MVGAIEIKAGKSGGSRMGKSGRDLVDLNMSEVSADYGGKRSDEPQYIVA